MSTAPRFYHPAQLQCGDVVELNDNAFRHAVKVLRLQVGDELTLFNGEGGEFRASLVEVEKRRAKAQLKQFNNPDLESPLQITLLQSISKGERMDYTIQKAVELGVRRIIPLVTARTVVNLKGERAEKRLSHWQGVITAACEQCGRNRLPQLDSITSYTDALQLEDELRIMLDHRSDKGVGQLKLGNSVTLLIGPEGGLSEEERSQAQDAGFTGVQMGPRVLRTETAALAAVAILQAKGGDF